MKKSIITLALAVLAGQAWGRTLTPEEALSRVAGNSSAPAKVAAFAGTARTVTPVMTLSNVNTGSPSLYVIAPAEGKGFMIVSADDVAMPLLGYSDNGTFDPENIPDNMRWWLSTYSEDIALASVNGAAPCTSPVKAPSRNSVAPLITSRWNQDAPYNDDCPMLNGRRTVTGCVATAMAQILNYHKWPDTGTNTASYTWNNETLSFDFANTTFKWDQMLNTYDATSTEEQRAAVAELMYACGVSVNMNYHYEASGALSSAVAPALRDYFNYDQAIETCIRYSYSTEDWENLVYTELTTNGPVYYAGQGEEGGHAFVCDGYADGYFHFNWGWGGMSDGYFLLNALDPASQGIGGYATGFNQRQTIVTNVRKPQADSKPSGPKLAMMNPLNVYREGANLVITGPFYNYSAFNLRGNMAVKFVNTETGEELTRRTISTVNLPAGYLFQKFSINPSNLPVGSWKGQVGILISGEFYPIIPCIGDTGYILLTVTAEGYEAQVERVGELKFSGLEAVSPFYVDKIFGLKANYNLASESPLYTTVLPVLMDESGSQIANGTPLEIELSPGQGELEYLGEFTTNVRAGSYYIALYRGIGIDTNGRTMFEPVSEMIPITINTLSWTRPAIVSSPSWDIVNADAVDPSQLTITADVQVTMGYYAGTIMACIFDNNVTNLTPSNALSTYYSGNLFVDQSEKKEAVITADFLQAVPKETYRVKLFLSSGTTLSQTVKTFTVGESTAISDIEADQTEGNAVYFNLQGVRVENPSQGLYIRRQGDKAEKVYIR